MSKSNRAMLLTPPGVAAISVVRLVGPGVEEFLHAHFERALGQGRPVHGTLRDGEKIIDDPVVVLSADGQIADINLHGGSWIVRAIMGLAKREGFAIQQGDTSVTSTSAIDADNDLQREILTHLPLATTELALRSLLVQE